MGNYTDAQRAKMPTSAFCDPKNRAFPVLDAEDARKALKSLGRASGDSQAIHTCIVNRIQRHKWDVNYNPDFAAFEAAFSADALGEGEDTVLRTGPIFECGDYPDKAFALTEAEADAAIAAFTPVAADYAHTPGPLDGQLGDLLTVWRDGPTLYGTAAVPRWVDTVLARAGHKISLAWDRATKQIVGWGWVTDPRISHAQLQAAFAVRQASDGPGRQTLVNAAHDMLVHAGAACPGMTPQPASGKARYAQKEARMSPIEQFMAWLNGGSAPPVAEDAAGAGTPVLPPAQFADQQRDLEQERQQLAADRAAFARERYWQQAESTVDALIYDGKVLPAEDPPSADGKRALVALFAQALADDATGTAIFGQAQGSRYAALQAAYAARQPQVRFGEQLPVQTLETGPEKAPADAAAREQELLAKSSVGQRVLQMRGQKEH